MPTFSSKPHQPSVAQQNFFARLRKYPFLLFGLPFISIVVVSSFALEGFTRTKYDLHDNKVTAMSAEEELKMRKDRKKIDIREEYYRLSTGLPTQSSSLDAGAPATPIEDTTNKRKRFSLAPTSRDELENVRVPRPAGMPEWGPALESADDAPKVGSRTTDRWV